jgi:CRP/FNR family transcriptional regulator, cyclic AMP receptor protein
MGIPLKKPSVAPLKKKAGVKKASGAQKKSGIKKFESGAVIFKENDNAESLFIIQKGQVRLYRPKGRGFVDIAVLRSGEVIGEMAYFDDGDKRRSCSASAIVPTEIIEISFAAFGKTMQGLNPWFKTIINTLADRLRKTNEKVKSLESNSLGFGQGGKISSYKFFHNVDIIKMLSFLYLCFKIYGVKSDHGSTLHIDKFKFYIIDLHGFQEVKYEEFMHLLINENFIKMTKDSTGLEKIINVRDIELLRDLFMYINAQRVAGEDKQIIIGHRCELLLEVILKQITDKGIDKPKTQVNVSMALDTLEEEGAIVSEEDLKDAVEVGICEDILVDGNNMRTSVVDVLKIKKMFPPIKLLNAVTRFNDKKMGDDR